MTRRRSLTLPSVRSTAPHLPLLLALVVALLPFLAAARGIEVEGEGRIENAFVEPIYGWSIAWDAAVWEVVWSGNTAVNEDGFFGGAVSLGSDVAGGVSIAGFPAYEGDAGECLAAAAAPREGLAEYEPVEDDVDLPAAPRDAENGLFQIDNGRVTYLECRTLIEDEAVLRVEWFAGEFDDYEANLARFEELMTGLDLSDVHPAEDNHVHDLDQATEEGVNVESIEVELEEVEDSGVSGDATVSDNGDGITITIEIDEGAVVVGQPAYVHEGTCENLNPSPSFPLRPIDEEGRSETRNIDVNFADLIEEPHAIALHRSRTELDTVVACGELAG